MHGSMLFSAKALSLGCCLLTASGQCAPSHMQFCCTFCILPSCSRIVNGIAAAGVMAKVAELKAALATAAAAAKPAVPMYDCSTQCDASDNVYTSVRTTKRRLQSPVAPAGDAVGQQQGSNDEVKHEHTVLYTISAVIRCQIVWSVVLTALLKTCTRTHYKFAVCSINVLAMSFTICAY
jgi:hypothetical protein